MRCRANMMRDMLFKERERLGSGTSAHVSLAWFLLAVRARRELTVTDSLVHLIGSSGFAHSVPAGTSGRQAF
jgi:hypothetical protein